jgi:hypothetical protein
MVLTTDRIEAALTAYMPHDDAVRHAHWVVDDMQRIGFVLQLATENPPGMWKHKGITPQTEYVVPSDFDINSDKDDKAMSGSFVTCGNILRLSQCVKIARELLPSMWPGDFAQRLLSAEHLDALNEIWWLKFWRGIQRVERGPKANRRAPDFDWFLQINDGLVSCRLNLEVKRRTGNLNSNFKRGQPYVSIDEIAHKFGPVADDTANIAAITAFVPLARESERWITQWFQTKPHVHALLIWIEGNLGSTPLLKLIKPEKKWVGFLVREPEPEDLKVAGRTAGTLCKTSEAPLFISKLAEAHDRPTIYRP